MDSPQTLTILVVTGAVSDAFLAVNYRISRAAQSTSTSGGRASSRRRWAARAYRAFWVHCYRKAEVIARYEAWLLEQPELVAALPELAGKGLRPQVCAGQR